MPKYDCVLRITTTTKNQTHPIWYIDYQMNRSIYYDQLINNQAKDWILDSLNSKSNSNF